MAALEDVRLAPDQDELASQVLTSMDEISESLDDVINSLDTDDDQQKSSNEMNDTETSHSLDNETSHHVADNDEEIMPDPVLPQVGDNIEVYWPLDMKYYPGTVTNVADTGYHTVSYSDGDTEDLLIDKEDWRFSSAHTVKSSTITSLPMLTSNEQCSLQSMLQFFGNKPFLI